MIDTIFAIDVNDENTYLIDRINKHLTIYNDRPFLIAYTSSSHVEGLMQSSNMRLVPYPHSFSLAAQKNRASERSTAPYLLLSDPDFFSYSNIYKQFECLLESTKSTEHPPFFFFPTLYAKENWSNIIFNSPKDSFDNVLSSFIFTSLDKNIYDNCLFIAPYSNVILISRELFYFIGGYNENFKGFGSEDFEFMVRAFIALGIKPLPQNINLDLYQPTTKHFFRKEKKFSGFRSLLTLYSSSVSNMGYNMVHLFHKKGKNDWYSKKDSKRINFNKQVIPYLKDHSRILDMDWINHDSSVICMITDIKKWRLFLTLRPKGYKTIRHVPQYINIDIIRNLSQKHNVKKFAFLKQFSHCNDKLIKSIKYYGYNIIEVDDNDLSYINSEGFTIDKHSYSSIQCGFTRQTVFKSLFNLLYDSYYRIKHFIKTLIIILKHSYFL